LGKQLVDGVAASLQRPLEDLAEGVRRNTQGNSEAVAQLLTDVLAGFSDRLQELFGGPISGINSLQQKTIDALDSAVLKLNHMASTIETMGVNASTAMNERLLAALAEMDSHQKLANERMAAFIEQLRGIVSESQTETNRKVQDTLADIGEAVRAQLSALKEQGDRAATSHAEQEVKIAERTQEAVRLLGSRDDEVLGSLKVHSDDAAASQIEREERLTALTADAVAKLSSVAETLMGEVHEMTTAVRAAIDAMRNVTTEAVSKMNSGAELLALAAGEFTKAGDSMSGTIRQAAGLTDGLQEAAGTVANASAALQGILADHGAARQTFASMLSDLRGMVDNAKKESLVTADVLSRIEQASQKLGQAQKAAEHYLAGVSDILTESHQTFASSLKSVLGESYKEFYGRLAAATGLLRDAIQELATAAEPAMRSS
jgi:hypothetical protein